jgi:hypothetical protein
MSTTRVSVRSCCFPGTTVTRGCGSVLTSWSVTQRFWANSAVWSLLPTLKMKLRISRGDEVMHAGEHALADGLVGQVPETQFGQVKPR